MATGQPKRRHPAFQDVTRRTFGRLTVEGEAGHRAGYVLWRCRCECGRVCFAVVSDLKRDNTASCGCLDYDRKLGNRRARKHGLHCTPEWKTWSGIRNRCHNPDATFYPKYGGRGIVVCTGWRNSVESFVADMGPKPSPKHSIDRINNAHGYTCGHCPECLANGWLMNCRWATARQQSENRHTTHWLTYNGLTLTTTEWARRVGLNKSCLFHRLASGWPVSDALTVPARGARRPQH